MRPIWLRRSLAKKYKRVDLPAFLKEQKNVASVYSEAARGGLQREREFPLLALKRRAVALEDWSEPEETED